MYRKGDEVLVKGVISMIDPHDDELPYRVDFLADDCDIWLSEKTIVSLVKASTAIPKGWNPVSVLVANANSISDYSLRNVCLLRTDGTQGYGWALQQEKNVWKWFGTKYDPQMTRTSFQTEDREDITDVIAWKELDPQTKVSLPDGWNSPDTLENREDHTNTRNVQVIRKDGQTGYGWRGLSYWYFTETYRPEMHNPESSYGESLHNTNNPVVGWKELDPELPEEWTPASIFPQGDENTYSGRNVQVLLKDGTQGYGWHCNDDSYWMYLGTDYSPDMHQDLFNDNQVRSDDVVGWKELPPLEPEPENPALRLKVGDKIVYRTNLDLGVGTIRHLDYDDPTCPYQVDFDHQIRWVTDENAVKLDL